MTDRLAPWWAGRAWAMEPAALAQIVTGAEFDASAFLDEPTSQPGFGRSGGAAVVRVHGPLSAEPSFWSAIFGGSAYSDIRTAVAAADADASVSTIVLDIDSPGGDVTGAIETAAAIRATTKPVTARISGLACSAGYWLASAASRIEASPTARIGCLGVIVAAPGVADGRGVVEFTSSQTPQKNADPASAEGATQFQAVADELADVFLGDVARLRGVPLQKVVADYGAGATVVAARALAAGMVDALTGEPPAAPVTSSLSGAAVVARSQHEEGSMTPEEMEARIAELEAELAAANAEIEELKGSDDGDGAEADAANERAEEAEEAAAAMGRQNAALSQQVTALGNRVAASEKAAYETVRGAAVDGLLQSGRINVGEVAQATAAYDAEKLHPELSLKLYTEVYAARPRSAAVAVDAVGHSRSTGGPLSRKAIALAASARAKADNIPWDDALKIVEAENGGAS